jgi:hypothetical protein
VGTGIRTHASSHHYSFGFVFTSYAQDFKHIEGAVQETASIKRHWQRASSSIAGGSTRDPSSGGKRISLSPMPKSTAMSVHMGTDDNGYELASLAKRQKLRNDTRFQPIHPHFWG